MKKLVALICTIALTMGVVAGCGSKGEEGKKVESGKLKEVHQAVKDAYGESYLATMEMGAEEIEAKFGIKVDMVKEVIAEIPMIGMHPDTFVGVEAAEGKVDEVEKALNTYRDALVADTMQYPMNLPKIEASQVVKVGDYVFFVLLGEIPMEVYDSGDDAKILESAKAENKKAVDAINKTLGQ